MEAAIADTDLPIALHLDHGADFDICKACVDGGFSSVMIDGSKYSFEENIALTRKVVEYAHAHGVVVEGRAGYSGPASRTMCMSRLTMPCSPVPRRSRSL